MRTVSDGEAALASIAQDPPDLVLLDVMIPGRDGYAVCQGIRANPAWRNVRIISGSPLKNPQFAPLQAPSNQVIRDSPGV